MSMALGASPCPFRAGQTWNSFQRHEQKLFESMRYVSLDLSNLGTWGEGYADILRSVGDDMDSFFREMVACSTRKCPYLPKKLTGLVLAKPVKDWTIEDYRKTFEPIYEPSKVEIQIRAGPNEIPARTPFKGFDSTIPTWWTAYNHIKHQYYEKMSEATLENVIDSLGGLAILNSLHKCSQTFLVRSGILAASIGDKKVEKRVKPEYLLSVLRKSSTGLPASHTDIASAWLASRMYIVTLREDSKA